MHRYLRIKNYRIRLLINFCKLDNIINKMTKQLNYSFNSAYSQINNLEITTKQQSILNQYNKLKESQQTPFYSIETLPYSQIPKFASKEIAGSFSQCIYLDKFTFYQMFTMLIVQYLFKGSNNEKLSKINHLKSLIYSPQFLEGSHYTKGLLVKGFKILEQYSNAQQFTHPIGQSLLNSDSICAFTECWKELIIKICEQKNIAVMSESEIDSSIFQIFASYFHINFNVYWKEKSNRLWKEHFTFDKAHKNTETLSVIVNPQYQISVSQRSIKVTQSRISGNSSKYSNNSWNYIVLTNPPSKVEGQNSSPVAIKTEQRQPKTKINHKAQLPNGEEISRISEIEYSCGQAEQIKILLQQKEVEDQTAKKAAGKSRVEPLYKQKIFTNIMTTMNKANSLIEQMRSYSQYLQKIELPRFQILGDTVQ